MRFGVRNEHHGRRAISEMVSTLLLVAIVVSLGVLIFTFANAGLSSLTGNFGGLVSNGANAVSERFVVEQVTFVFSAPTGANVYVRNVGALASTLVSVYVVDQSNGAFQGQFAIASGSGAVNVGSYLEITSTTVNFTPTHGHAYSFTVTSNLGNSVIFYAAAS